MFAVKENPPCRHIANIQASYQLQNKDHSLNFGMHADNKYSVSEASGRGTGFVWLGFGISHHPAVLWPTSHGKSSHLCQHCQPNPCPRPHTLYSTWWWNPTAEEPGGLYVMHPMRVEKFGWEQNSYTQTCRFTNSHLPSEQCTDRRYLGCQSPL